MCETHSVSSCCSSCCCTEANHEIGNYGRMKSVEDEYCDFNYWKVPLPAIDDL